MSLYRVLAAMVIVAATAAPARAQQTIVFLRHGEKPSGGLGQLTCQGLNRAMALPDVLTNKFGRPDFVYAPNPNVKISDPAGSFYYVRPLATIEPTAIRAGISVNTHYGFNETTSLQSLLIQSAKANTTIFVTWEHSYLVKIVQSIMSRYGDGTPVPAWVTGDYDSLYVLTVDYAGGAIHAHFEHDHEGLNGLPTTCP
jgi:hypothetical protein